MAPRPTLLAIVLAGLSVTAQATTPKEQYAIDSKAATTRYADDKKICADESDSSKRMQCLRDAKAENTKALSAAKATLAAASKHAGACLECGKVTAVHMKEKDGEGGALGLIAGGAAGALLGHQVGGGRGRDVATVAGAVGGAYAGKKVQEKATATKVWTVDVQYDDGSKGSYNFDHDPG
ncbi:MAG: glycine zipper 2TM domain-containing protein, partial [Pseudomonadota bacterium]